MENFKQKLILASNSPRRKQILIDSGFDVQVVSNKVNEEYPDNLPAESVAKYLAEKKASQFKELPEKSVLITADTVVKLGQSILGKPRDTEEGFTILRMLSGVKHEVITGVCMKSSDKTVSFDDTTSVYFRELSDDEIAHYLKTYFPFDKAGAYGIQEWLGMIAVQTIHGSYYNVVGLPIHKVYQTLLHEFT